MENVILCLILTPLLLVPLAMKWELEPGKVAAAGTAIALFAGVMLECAAILYPMGFLLRLFTACVMILVLSGAALLLRFYRDPERSAPVPGNVIVAPADGVIKYIRSIGPEGKPLSSKGSESVRLAPPLMDILPGGRGHLVGIGMSFLDVHVTRAPIKGKITFLEHVPGSFMSLKRPEAVYRNERMNQVIENCRYRVGLIHIASRLVRQIVSYAAVGDRLLSGQRLGMIRFGSQVDILLPDHGDLEIMAGVGDRVIAGETIIAMLKNR